MKPLNFQVNFKQECLVESAISPDLYSTAIEFISDTGKWEPNLALGHKISRFWTTGSPGWDYRTIACFHQETGVLWQCKPENPRTDKKGKLVKYDAPKSVGSTPYLPPVDTATRLKINALWKTEIPLDGPFWPHIKAHPKIPIVITEGAKKALALLSQGFVAISVYGVNSGYQTLDKLAGKQLPQPRLIPGLEGLVGKDRKVYLAFDQDSKAETRKKVSKAIAQFAKLIESAKSKAFIMQWSSDKGKGIDDVLAGLPECDRLDWLKKTSSQALELKKWKRQRTIELSRAILSQGKLKPNHKTSGEYLPTLPELKLGAVNVIDAPMGSGKTVRVVADWMKPFIQSGGVVLWLAPLNSLGRQTSLMAKIPHVHDYFNDENGQKALRAQISYDGGLVSTQVNPRNLGLMPKNRPLLLVLDEAAQSLDTLAEGGTTKGRWAQAWEDLIELMQRAASNGAIVLAEDGLKEDTVSLVQTLAGTTERQVIHHEKTLTIPWPVEIGGGAPHGYRKELTTALEEGKNVFFVTTSQAEGVRLEEWAKDRHVDYERVDSETNEAGRYRTLFEKPDEWLEERKPQLLILTPTGGTGLSMQGGVSVEDAYFDEVWGYFPALDTDRHMQLLGRYRPAVARKIFVPGFIQPSYGECAAQRKVKQQLEDEVSKFSKAGGFSLSEEGIQSLAIKDFLAKRRSRRWAQKVDPTGSLAIALKERGHQGKVGVKFGESFSDEEISDIKDEWSEIKDAIAHQKSDFHAALKVEEEHDLSWAYEMLQKGDTTYENRCRAHKVMTAARFPGLNWDSSELWYEAQFAPKRSETHDDGSRGPLAPGAALWAEADHYKALWEGDRNEAESLLQERLRAAHLLPQNAAKAALTAVFKSLVQKLLKKGEIHHDGAIVKEIKKLALLHADNIHRYWRLICRDDQSPQAITNKICRKLGFVLQRSSCKRFGKSRVWDYSISAVPTWQKLVDSRTEVLKGLVTNPFKETNNKSVTTKSPPGRIGAAALGAADLEDLKEWFKGAKQQGVAAIKALRESLLSEFTPDVWSAIAG